MKDPQLSLALFTDFYELTMAQAYWHSGRTGTATFSLFFRNYPRNRAYFVFAGLADILDYLENFRLTPADVAYLRSLRRFDAKFLDFLQDLRFSGSVRAMTEATIFFTNEPVVEVTGPVIEAQLAETFLLNQVNVQTLLAMKASRVVHAARGRQLVDFAARRTQGVDSADKLARASYMVGFDSTSNTLAGARYDIPVSGTMAHSYITSFENETESFRQFAKSFPDASTFLVDTYDTPEGTRKAIAVALEMKQQGRHLQAIRLDSGDLLDLSRKARALLDDAGLRDVQIFASGGLDEFEVDDLLRAGAPIDAFGIGTKVAVSADAPWTDCAYKMVEYSGRPVLKLSSKKETLPGAKQVFRRLGPDKQYSSDVVACADEPPPTGAIALLTEVMCGGKPLSPPPNLRDLRQRFREEFARLPARHKAIRSPELYTVEISEQLIKLRQQVAEETRKGEIGADR